MKRRNYEKKINKDNIKDNIRYAPLKVLLETESESKDEVEWYSPG